MRYTLGYFFVFVLALGLSVFNQDIAQAAVTATITCDINQDGTDETVEIIGHKSAKVTLSGSSKVRKVDFSGKKYPPSKYTVSCADGNDEDTNLDLVFTRNGKSKTFSFYTTSSFTACKSIQNWPGTLIYKTIGSDHFSSGDPRRNAANVIAKFGFRGSDSCIDVYATNGTKLGSMGYYGPWVGGPARWYGPTGCGSISLNGNGLANKARQASGNTNIIVKIANTCYGPIDARSCVGSVSC